MIRVVLDTNVFVSAAIDPRGPPGQIVSSFILDRTFEVVLSPGIIIEIQRAFRRKRISRYLNLPYDAQLWFMNILVAADVVEDTHRIKGICRDPNDDMIISTAIEGNANSIVTGDKDLLTLKEHTGIFIVSPRTFLRFLRGEITAITY